jgi:hypothetical protein
MPICYRDSAWLLASCLAAVSWLAAPLPAQETRPREPDRSWSGEVDGSVWILPDDPDFILLQAYADRGPLHLEGRYNYEDLRTGSLWVGWTWDASGKISLSVTPALGVVFGNTGGLAPGLEIDVVIGPVEWYGESEYLFDFDSAESDFFYMWSELGVSPVDWFTVGLAVQRTRVVDTPREIQRGVFVGAFLGPIGLTGYLMNPDGDEHFGVVQLEYHF